MTLDIEKCRKCEYSEMIKYSNIEKCKHWNIIESEIYRKGGNDQTDKIQQYDITGIQRQYGNA